jgi:hypothetical protein
LQPWLPVERRLATAAETSPIPQWARSDDGNWHALEPEVGIALTDHYE